VGAAVLALASSTVAGASIGLVLAASGRASGVRPRAWLRRAGSGLTRAGSVAAVAASALAIVGGLGAQDSQPALALTCFGAAALIAFATWLLLVEPEDDDSTDGPNEPDWWPAFERELEDWTRGRVPTGGRR
jgi:hypothetical protein